jgi:hypothetical protein
MRRRVLVTASLRSNARVRSGAGPAQPDFCVQDQIS